MGHLNTFRTPLQHILIDVHGRAACVPWDKSPASTVFLRCTQVIAWIVHLLYLFLQLNLLLLIELPSYWGFVIGDLHKFCWGTAVNSFFPFKTLREVTEINFLILEWTELLMVCLDESPFPGGAWAILVLILLNFSPYLLYELFALVLVVDVKTLLVVFSKGDSFEAFAFLPGPVHLIALVGVADEVIQSDFFLKFQVIRIELVIIWQVFWWTFLFLCFITFIKLLLETHFALHLFLSYELRIRFLLIDSHHLPRFSINSWWN